MAPPPGWRSTSISMVSKVEGRSEENVMVSPAAVATAL